MDKKLAQLAVTEKIAYMNYKLSLAHAEFSGLAGQPVVKFQQAVNEAWKRFETASNETLDYMCTLADAG